MATSGGHLLVSRTLRLVRFGIEKATRAIRDKLPQAAQVEARTEHVHARISKQSLNRVAAIRQSQSRSYYTAPRAANFSVRYFSSTTHTSSRPLRSSYPKSRTSRAVSQITSRTPFASTLRPNLTGGTLSRGAGGYNTGAGRINGVRYFSHTPATSAEVVQNVSQAVRAFWLSGQKAHFDGNNPRTGEKRFRAVSALQDKTRHNLDLSHAHSAGSYIDFKVSPTITAIGPLSTVPRSALTSTSCDFEPEVSAHQTITNEAFITTLSVDFARALKDLAAIMNDLKHLATLGDLPIFLVDATTLRVRFPGCDAETVESLCIELNIRRGIVGQDEDFDTQHGAELALLFPFAPSKTPSETMCDFEPRPTKRSKRDHVDWHGMMSPARIVSPGFSHKSATSHDFEEVDGAVSLMREDGEIVENPWLSAPSGYSSLHPSDDGGDVALFFAPQQTHYPTSRGMASAAGHTNGYEGLEGIYKFIEECDRVKR